MGTILLFVKIILSFAVISSSLSSCYQGLSDCIIQKGKGLLALSFEGLRTWQQHLLCLLRASCRKGEEPEEEPEEPVWVRARAGALDTDGLSRDSVNLFRKVARL